MIFPAIRQFRGRFFYFFLILALGDPITLIILLTFNLEGPHFQPLIITSLLVLSILDAKSKRNYIFVITLLLMNLFISIWFADFKITYSMTVILHIIIFYKILIIFIKKNVDEKAVNIFYIIFLLGELIIITKISNIIFGITNAPEFIIISAIIQIPIALYFSFFRDDDPRNFIKLR